MENKSPSEFRIHFNGENPDNLLREERENARVEKLSHRVTLISIVIPVLIGVILLMAYVDIKSHVSRIHDTDSVKVRGLSKDLESRFSSLSVQYAKLDNLFRKKSLELEMAVASLTRDLESVKSTLDNAVKDIETTRSDKTTVERTLAGLTDHLAEIENKFAPIHQQLDTTRGEIQNMDDHLNQELALLEESLKQKEEKLDRFATSLSDVTRDSINQTVLSQALNQEQKRYGLELEKLSLKFQNELKPIRKKIQELENLKILSEKLLRTQPQQNAANAASSSGATPAAQPPLPSTVSPGSIIEQDIQ